MSSEFDDGFHASLHYRLTVSIPGLYALFLRFNAANVNDTVKASVLELADG